MDEELEKLKRQLRTNPAFAQITVDQSGANLTGWFILTESETAEALREAQTVLQNPATPALPPAPPPLTVADQLPTYTPSWVVRPTKPDADAVPPPAALPPLA